jgi:hypothetical protein
MIDPFKIFFERRERNPLRKQRLRDSGDISNIEYIEQEKQNLNRKEQAKINRMIELDVPEELVTKFKNAKIAEKEKQLKQNFLRTKLDEKNFWFKLSGVKVYVDKYVENPLEFEKKKLNRVTMQRCIEILVKEHRDIIPIRKFNIVITDTQKNPLLKKLVGKKNSKVLGAYRSRIVYINQYSIDDPDVLLHEYAHFIADMMPKEIYPMLQREYNKMLENFFNRKTKRKALEGDRNESLRAEVAEKMGLPSEYSATNPDEWFAVLIENWKKFPNNSATYRFKSILKKIISRL